MDQQEHVAILEATNLAIQHIIDHGTDDIFRHPMFSNSYEHRVLQDKGPAFAEIARKETIKFLSAANLEHNKPGRIYHCLIPKDLYSYRKVHWIDPFDLAKYLALSIVLSKDIEASRPQVDELAVHSHRKSPAGSGRLFLKEYGYDSFRERSGEISRQNIGKWKITTDISSFFDRIGNHPLENNLIDAGCPKKHVDLLKNMLLLWIGDRKSFGIPIGCDASRIISEAALLTVDRKLKEKNIDYVRYVDDFRLFADTRAQAYEHLRTLSELLMDEGLHLNDKKTFVTPIVSEKDFKETHDPGFSEEHEIIDENKKILKPIRVRVSGRSALSKHYVQPGREAIANLKKKTKDQVRAEFLESTDYERQNNVKLVVKYFIYVDNDHALIDMVLSENITSIIYVVDALTKEVDRLSEDLRLILKDRVFGQMGGLDCGYPFRISLLKLFASPGYEDARLINDVVDNARLLDSPLFLRQALFIGFRQIDRNRIKKLACEAFNNAPALTQRAIYYAFTRCKNMAEDQKRPIMRNIKLYNEDWFICNDTLDWEL